MSTPAAARDWALTSFILGPSLGSGRFGRVYMARDKESGVIYALKQVAKQSKLDTNQTSALEYECHRLCSTGPHVVQIFGSFETCSYVYFVLQHIPGKSLYELMEEQVRMGARCREADVHRWMKQVLVAIKHCHARGVMHRDIKLENILIHNKTNDAYLVDFGLATTAKTSGDCVGTVDYMSPQMILRVNRSDPDAQHTNACDIWSVGVAWYEALTGRTPFGDESEDFEPTYARILENRFTDPDALQVPEPLKDLLTSMLQTSEAARPTALQACLHRWWQTFATPQKHTDATAQ